MAWGYAFVFGIFETFGIPFRVPGLTWQVPSRWVKGRSKVVKTLIWGIVLGPGLVTNNPYAGIWLLPFLVALNHSLLPAVVVSTAVGFAHGIGRAAGVLSNRRYMSMNCGDLLIMGKQIRWQFMDGLVLLLAAGLLTSHVLSILI